MTKRRYFCGGSIVAVVAGLGFAGAAAAQPAPAAPPPGGPTVSEVVVTGSFIRGTPEDAALPVKVIGAEELEKQGSPSTLELIKALPVSSGILGETNQFDTRSQGSEGSGSINLRGLGANRTLVLINGRRMAYNPFGQGAAGIVDTNVLPAAAFGRVEILKEGAAATYGSDAIAGVVNFITRKNLDGVEVAGSYRWVDGSDGDWDASANFGKIFDHGNVLFSLGYQHRSELSTRERDWALQPFANSPEGGWSGGNAVTSFVPLAQAVPGGPYTTTAPYQLDAGCAVLGGVPQPPAAFPSCRFQYTAYDNLVEDENRYQVYGEANVDLDEHNHVHVEGLYAKTDVPQWKTSPSYLALQTPTALTNPTVGLLPAAVIIPAGYFVPSTNPGFIAYQAQHPTSLPAGSVGVHIPGVQYRPLSMGGNPIFDDNGSSEGLRQYEAWRISMGMNGDLPWHDIGYDVAVTYSAETGRRTGYDTVASRLQLALRGYGSLSSATDGGCTAAKTANFTTNAGNNAIGCYYFNPFSTGIPSSTSNGASNPGFVAAAANNPDVIRWFFPQVSTKQTVELLVADAVLNGKTGFSLPGGEVAWAAGVQFRNERYDSKYSNFTNVDVEPCIDTPFNGTTSCTVRNGPLVFLGTAQEQELHNHAYAGFGELRLPVTDSIDAQLAVRYEKYGMGVGSTTNPKLSVKWQINDWLALRGTVGTTFRGPPLTALANSSGTALSFIAGSFRAIDIFGNPNLRPEKAKEYSVGAIVKVGGFRGSVDWWRFDFDNPIVTEPSGPIVATMFPANSAVNCGQAAFAALQARFTFQGACSVTTIARVKTFVVNGPSIQTSGIDVVGDYDVGEYFGGHIQVGGTATYTLEYKIDPFSVAGVLVQPGFDAAGFLNYQTSATSLPQLKAQVYAEYATGPHNVRLTVDYIDSYDDQRAIFGTISHGQKIDATWIANLSYRVLLPWDTTASFTIENLFDEDPSFARLDLNYDPFTGDPLGRRFKVSLKKKF